MRLVALLDECDTSGSCPRFRQSGYVPCLELREGSGYTGPDQVNAVILRPRGIELALEIQQRNSYMERNDPSYETLIGQYERARLMNYNRA
jgi:hypothetical protein